MSAAAEARRWRDAFARDFAGKAVLVTGASSGIGAAVAAAFGSCGARVGVHFAKNRAGADSVAAAVRRHGGEAMTFAADLSRDTSPAARLVGEAVAAFGGLDILINNAGEPIARTPTVDTGDEFYDRVMDLNFRSVFACSRAAAPIMRRAGGGAIVNTSSIGGRTGGAPGSVLYAAAKAAVNSLTRGLARELVGDGVRVNAVSPGIVATPLHERLTSPALMERFVAAVPMGRAATAEEMVGAYLFLASPTLAGYVTGQVVEVNGGMLMP